MKETHKIRKVPVFDVNTEWFWWAVKALPWNVTFWTEPFSISFVKMHVTSVATDMGVLIGWLIDAPDLIVRFEINRQNQIMVSIGSDVNRSP